MPSYVATGVKAHLTLFSDYRILNYGTTVMTQLKRVATSHNSAQPWSTASCRA
jgi:hypothetical protein